MRSARYQQLNLLVSEATLTTQLQRAFKALRKFASIIAEAPRRRGRKYGGFAERFMLSIRDARRRNGNRPLRRPDGRPAVVRYHAELGRKTAV